MLVPFGVQEGRRDGVDDHRLYDLKHDGTHEAHTPEAKEHEDHREGDFHWEAE